MLPLKTFMISGLTEFSRGGNVELLFIINKNFIDINLINLYQTVKCTVKARGIWSLNEFGNLNSKFSVVSKPDVKYVK